MKRSIYILTIILSMLLHSYIVKANYTLKYNTSRFNIALSNNVIAWGLRDLNVSNISITFNEVTNVDYDMKVDYVNDSTYIININTSIFNKDKFEIMVTLLHELKHIQQYHTKQLINVENGVTYKGKFIDNETNYNQRPYEVDAFRYSERAILRYK